MPKKIAETTLNASTLDIMNVIRANASYDYQNAVPVVAKATDVPKVGEVIYGTPAFANQFVNALVNRIASVRVQSATFNNPFAVLKKGYIEFGESIEDIFVGIAKVVDYSAEKAKDREFKRTLPDVKSVFHVMNWRTMYPVTIQDEDLRLAFLSVDGVTDLIAKIVEQVYTAEQYDEYLLAKYLIIKAGAHGAITARGLGNNVTSSSMAKAFRSISNSMTFMSNNFNEAQVRTTTPRDKQFIVMDSDVNATMDVDVLAVAFNMDKAEFFGRLLLIDSFTDFDNERFDIIRANSDGLEEVTSAELALMKNVKAIIFDENWFQIYDNNNKFTEQYVASGMYWNYFYHTWKTISHSPFANAVMLVDNQTNGISIPEEFDVTIASKDVSDAGTVFTFAIDALISFDSSNIIFIQNENATNNGIGIQPYGAMLIPKDKEGVSVILTAKCYDKTFSTDDAITGATAVGTKLTFNRN